MNRKFLLTSLGYLLCSLWLSHARPALGIEARNTAIITAADASWTEKLAAREVRRYVYLRTGLLLPILGGAEALDVNSEGIIVARKDRPFLKSTEFPDVTAAIEGLLPQSYLLKTLPHASLEAGKSKPGGARSRVLFAIGGDDSGTLYAAYRLAEALGARFYLHGDVLPDEQIKWKLPEIDEQASPIFALRGIQPFHNFPEGPDWWNRDDYLAILGQLPKLRMNFFGLHTYPEGRPNAEPTVWVGQAEDFGQGGKVSFSYPSSYQNTRRGNWGYAVKKTSDFIFGSALLFERDDFGSEIMTDLMPAPAVGEPSDELFSRTGTMLHDAFTFAHQLGIKTCVGTETPLIIPESVQERLRDKGKDPTDGNTAREVYEGIFRRANETYPLDYYWLWTPESWTWSAVKPEVVQATTGDFFAAFAAHVAVQPGFHLATCGWVLGPQQDRAMFDKVLPKEIGVSCINRHVGYTRVDPGFAQIEGRSKWAIPWLEDDPALTSPQLWVGRMRRDAADALRYGCDGLMGIHWRTRVLSPNIGALAHAGWEQKPWTNLYEPPTSAKGSRVPGPDDGQVASFPNNLISGTDSPPLYQTVRFNVSAYHLPVSNGACQVTLKFCEPHYDAVGKRVFDIALQGQPMVTNLDIFARVGKNRALDITLTNLVVTNGWLDIDFSPRVEFPCIAALEAKGESFTTRIDCGGPGYRDFAADPPGLAAQQQVYPITWDFYEDWAAHEFGPKAGALAAVIFERIDCKLPIPSVWTDGPGGIKPDARPWDEVRKDYVFVEEFAAIASQVSGPSNQERFDYWLNTFRYLRAIGKLNCYWGEFDHMLAKFKGGRGLASQQDLASKFAVPLFQKLLGQLEIVYGYLLATVSTTGELGTVANWNQHNLPALMRAGEELRKVLGKPLSADLQPSLTYHGPVRLIVPTKRTSVGADETLKLKVIVLAEATPREAALYWRKLGTGTFAKVSLQHLDRGVYSGELPPSKGVDFEYYVKVDPVRGRSLFFPPSAPRINQTVIVGGE